MEPPIQLQNLPVSFKTFRSIVMSGENSHQTVRQSFSHSPGGGTGGNFKQILECYPYNVFNQNYKNLLINQCMLVFVPMEKLV